MPARLNIHYRDRSDLPMSDRDIWLDYKNAKNPRMQVRILAELNETKKQVIEEIINEQSAIEERKVIERKLKEVEQVKQTEEERKAKKAAYMKEYWARKKAEKAEPQPTPVRPVTEPITTEQEPEVRPVTVYHVDTGVVEEKELAAALIDKAVRHYYEDLAEAVLDQRAVVDQALAKYEAAVRKYQEMQADLLRCKRYLGIPEEELQAEDEEVAENVCD